MNDTVNFEGPIISPEDVKYYAQLIFNYFDKSQTGYLQEFELKQMQSYITQMFDLTPDTEDDNNKSLISVLDLNRDGRVTLPDFEAYIYKYLSGLQDNATAVEPLTSDLNKNTHQSSSYQRNNQLGKTSTTTTHFSKITIDGTNRKTRKSKVTREVERDRDDSPPLSTKLSGYFNEIQDAENDEPNYSPNFRGNQQDDDEDYDFDRNQFQPGTFGKKGNVTSTYITNERSIRPSTTNNDSRGVEGYQPLMGMSSHANNQFGNGTRTTTTTTTTTKNYTSQNYQPFIGQTSTTTTTNANTQFGNLNNYDSGNTQYYQSNNSYVGNGGAGNYNSTTSSIGLTENKTSKSNARYATQEHALQIFETYKNINDCLPIDMIGSILSQNYGDLGEGVRPSEREVTEYFELIDTTGDKAATKDEFLDYVMRNFSKM